MKIYTSASVLLGQINLLLATNRPSFHRSPLDDLIQLLISGRHYPWVGIYLASPGTAAPVGAGHDSHHFSSPETCSKILVSMKIASREVGMLAVETDCEHGFSPEDRVLLEDVADLLARFLTGPGRYLAQRARHKAPVPSTRSVASGSP